MTGRVLTILILILGGIGFFAAGDLLLRQFQTGAACPVVAFVPLCVVVLAGYGAVLSSLLVRSPLSTWLFAVGLAPVLLLASIGVAAEIFIGETCPHTNSGVPKCFYSFGVAVLILALWSIHRRLVER